jgi:LPXTG-motif cell wall-anchored protein
MKKTKILLAVSCLAMLLGAFVGVDLAAAQATETVTVHIGTGTILHRSGATLIIDVKEGERGPGIRKINIRSTDGITFKDRLGNVVEVFDLDKGEEISAYRTETRPAPVKITMSEAEEIIKAEPAAPSRPEPAPAAAPAPAPEPKPAQLPSTGSSLPLMLLLGVLSLSLALGLRLARSRS